MATRKASPVTVDDVLAELGSQPTLAACARIIGQDGKAFRNGVRALGTYVSRGGTWDAATARALYDARPSFASRVDALVESRNA